MGRLRLREESFGSGRMGFGVWVRVAPELWGFRGHSGRWVGCSILS